MSAREGRTVGRRAALAALAGLASVSLAACGSGSGPISSRLPTPTRASLSAAAPTERTTASRPPAQLPTNPNTQAPPTAPVTPTSEPETSTSAAPTTTTKPPPTTKPPTTSKPAPTTAKPTTAKPTTSSKPTPTSSSPAPTSAAAPSASQSPASAETSDTGNSISGWWWLVAALVVLLGALGAFLFARSRRRSAWIAAAESLGNDTRTAVGLQVAQVLGYSDPQMRTMSWGPVEAELTALAQRWNASAATAPDDAGRSRSSELARLVGDLVIAIGAENNALAQGLDWSLLRPRIDEDRTAITRLLSTLPTGEPVDPAQPGQPRGSGPPPPQPPLDY